MSGLSAVQLGFHAKSHLAFMIPLTNTRMFTLRQQSGMAHYDGTLEKSHGSWEKIFCVSCRLLFIINGVGVTSYKPNFSNITVTTKGVLVDLKGIKIPDVLCS